MSRFQVVLALALAVVMLAAVGASAAEGTASKSEAAKPAASETSADTQNAQIQNLIDAIKNDDTRQKLIGALEKANVPASKESKTEEVSEAAKTSKVSSFGRQIAAISQSVVHTAALSTTRFVDQITAVPKRISAFGPGQMDLLLTALRDVAIAIVATYVVFFVLRALSIRLFRRIGSYAEESGILRTIFLVVISALIDAAVVVLAWAVGYLITTVVGTFGTVGIRQSLYLNAFLLVELFRVLLRIVLSPATADLRLVNISDRAARLLNNRLAWIAVILGYGQLFLTPVFNQSVSVAAGQALSVVLSLIALGIAVSLTVRKRREVHDWLLGETTDTRSPSRFARLLARNWYWVVLAYLAFLFVVVLTQPAANLLPILAATGKIVLALLIGFGITGWLGRLNRRGVTVPDDLKQKLPLLESRLNAFVPRILTTVRVIVFLAVLIYAINAVGLLNIYGWMQTDVGTVATTAFVTVVVILLVAFAIWLGMTSWVDYRLNPEFGSVPTTRETTLLTLLRNAATIALLIITLMFVLSEVGINIAPLIASAGVFGLAIGFGAQKLVQDIITGVFIQLENAINVGDVVTADGVTGTAERLTIRSLSIRDLDGTYHIIPFSSVTTVSNFMKGFSYSVCNMGVAYRENIDEVKDAMMAAFELLRSNPDNAAKIMGDIEWFGVTGFGDNAVTVRTRIKTLAGSQWGVGRAYNACLKVVFDERNIEIPFPHQTIYFGENKQGEAPVAHVRIADDQQKRRYGKDAAPRNTAGVLIPSSDDDKPLSDSKVPDDSDVDDKDGDGDDGIIR